MTHERLARARRFAADRAATARQVLRIGSWKVPVAGVAWSLSAILHAGLLTAFCFVTWSPTTVSKPEVSFAKGDRATQIQVLLVPWPDPSAEEEGANEESREKRSAVELSTVTVSTKNVETAPVPEVVASKIRFDPPVAASEHPTPPAEEVQQATNAAELPAIGEVRTDSPTDDADEAVAPGQPVAEAFEDLLDRLEGFLAPPETSEQVDRHQPSAADAVEDAAAPPTRGSAPSYPSPSQTAGVQTGVERVDFPIPMYPPVSRRRGEEGLVLLQVEILPDGSVGDITVLQDAGFVRLTEAAIAAARKGRFKPATSGGRAVRATVRIPFRFVLR